MADLIKMARLVLTLQNKEVTASSISVMEEELKRCKAGRKVQILIALEKTVRMTSSELQECMGLHGTNLTLYTKRLKKNGLIRIYDESDFKPVEEANFKFHYHSLTDLGRELISDLGK